MESTTLDARRGRRILNTMFYLKNSFEVLCKGGCARRVVRGLCGSLVSVILPSFGWLVGWSAAFLLSFYLFNSFPFVQPPKKEERKRNKRRKKRRNKRKPISYQKPLKC